MDWTNQQEDALSRVSAWLRDPYESQVFRLFGYAGTGKTTLAKYLVENENKKVAFGAYTGKAALVLRQKGCEGARTIHSLMYKSNEKDRSLYEKLEDDLAQAKLEKPLVVVKINDLQRRLKREKERLSETHFTLDKKGSVLNTVDLIVIDECSMIGEEMGRDLLSFKKKILVLGDPAQLPPIRGLGFFDVAPPDVLLTDVQRQARDNPIIDLATRVRKGEKLSAGHYGDSRVIEGYADINDMLLHDQVLVGTNRTRRFTNARIRHVKGLNSTLPVIGDRLICLRNDRDAGLLNGGQFVAVRNSEIVDDANYLSVGLRDLDGTTEFTEEEPFVDIAHVAPFIGGDMNGEPWFIRKRAQEFDYGYAITVHKSQGSQWNSCYVLDDWLRNDHSRWLYTAITRAAERVTIINNFDLDRRREDD